MGCSTSSEAKGATATANGPAPAQPFTIRILKQQDDATSNAVLALLQNTAGFHKLSETEGQDIIRRDEEDEKKLSVGIQIAVSNGVLPAEHGAPDAKKVDVHGKTAQQVAQEILDTLSSKTGNVLVLQGLSGTGKGTTVKKLQSALPRCICWSNGNVFRTLTHLATEVLGAEFQSEQLTPELLATLEKRLSFDKIAEGTFDVLIDGNVKVSDIQNTTLKMPNISAKVPTVAEQTQGHVIRFATQAVERLRADGFNVILEGRAQTLNYMPTPHRFELVMPNAEMLGSRRAAQRVMAKALGDLPKEVEDNLDEVADSYVQKALEGL